MCARGGGGEGDARIVHDALFSGRVARVSGKGLALKFYSGGEGGTRGGGGR